MNTVDDLAAQAQALSADERVELAERLLASVAAVDPDVDAAWADEIARRLHEVDSGLVQTIPADEAFAYLDRMLPSR